MSLFGFGMRVICCCSIIKSYLTLCDPIDCSTPDSSVLHYLLESAQVHVHWISDAIQPSHPLSLSCPSAFNLSQHQGLFKWVSSLHQVVKVLELQHQSFQWTFRTDFLQDRLVWSPCIIRDSQESSPTPQFESINSSVLRLLYTSTLNMNTGKIIALTRWTFVRKVISAHLTVKKIFAGDIKEDTEDIT